MTRRKRFDDSPEGWAQFGKHTAQHEADEGYKGPTGREDRKRWTTETYDGDHAEYFRRRDECIGLYLDAYYTEWRAIQEERRQARKQAEAPCAWCGEPANSLRHVSPPKLGHTFQAVASPNWDA